MIKAFFLLKYMQTADFNVNEEAKKLTESIMQQC